MFVRVRAIMFTKFHASSRNSLNKCWNLKLLRYRKSVEIPRGNVRFHVLANAKGKNRNINCRIHILWPIFYLFRLIRILSYKMDFTSNLWMTIIPEEKFQANRFSKRHNLPPASVTDSTPMIPYSLKHLFSRTIYEPESRQLFPFYFPIPFTMR